MKLIEIILYLIYKVGLLCLGLIFLFSIAIIAALTSWYYLLLYIPLLLYYYGSGTMDYGTKKHAFVKVKKFRR